MHIQAYLRGVRLCFLSPILAIDLSLSLSVDPSFVWIFLSPFLSCPPLSSPFSLWLIEQNQVAIGICWERLITRKQKSIVLWEIFVGNQRSEWIHGYYSNILLKGSLNPKRYIML